MKEITQPEVVLAFRQYVEEHPLRMLCNEAFDDSGNLRVDCMAKCVNAVNSINAISRALQSIAYVDEMAYKDMIENKLRAKHKKTYDLHNLISALCELSLMNTFIVRSSNPQSFKYEDKVRVESNKNIEFSIEMSDYLFHVEVKSSNLVKEDEIIVKHLSDNPAVLITDARVDNYEEISRTSTIPVMGSLDRRLYDFLKSADEKFASERTEKEINLLVICWDDRIHQPIIALKSEQAQGLLTNSSFMKDCDGKNVIFDNIDSILINSDYELMKEFVAGILFHDFTPVYPVDPFFQLFTANYLIDKDYSLPKVNLIRSIIQNDVVIVDEALIKTLPKMSIATLREDGVIKFRRYAHL